MRTGMRVTRRFVRPTESVNPQAVPTEMVMKFGFGLSEAPRVSIFSHGPVEAVVPAAS